MGGFMTIGHINTHICILFESRMMHLIIAAKYLNFGEVCC